MAKPIPVNRRWQENQRSRQANNANAAPAQPASPHRDYRELLRELLEGLRGSIQVNEPEPVEQALVSCPVEATERLVPRRDPPPRVIPARYRETCIGCGALINPGDPIARHPRWGDWVHVGCCDRQQRAARRVIEARYRGLCYACARPILPGQQITPQRGYGWVHLECASQ
ncbi:MAG: hypothetical protein N2554_11680 [Fimbriimonadales bacterium]|nr:hypothetical protein [Fimbriimonadales bacterium]